MEINVRHEENESKHSDLKKSVIAICRQFVVLLSGYLLMFVSGLHIGWGIFNPNLKAERWTETCSTLTINLVISSFYFGVFVGVLTGRSWFKNGTKTFNYQIAAVMSAITGISLIISPEQPIPIIIARLLAGFAIGLAYLTLIMQCDILTNKGRGILLSFTHFFIYLGVYTAITIIFIGHEIFEDPLDGKLQIIGTLVFLLSAGALACTFKLFRESPVNFVRQKNYDAALLCLLELRNENEVTHEIESEFNELKLMVQEDDKLNPSIVTEGNIKPLILMIAVATMSAFSFNYPLNIIRLNNFTENEHKIFIFVGILILIRIVFGVISCNLADIVGRKKIILISGCGSGVILVALGIISGAKIDLSPTVAIITFIVYELSTTLGVNSIMAVLMFEGFPLTKRSNSITTIMAFESLIHIILISATFDLRMTPEISSIFLNCFGGLMIGISVNLQFRLPETMGLTMRQARDAFRIKK